MKKEQSGLHVANSGNNAPAKDIDTQRSVKKHEDKQLAKKLSRRAVIILVITVLVVAIIAAAVFFVNSKLDKINYSDGVSTGTIVEEQRVKVDVSSLEKWEAPKIVEESVLLSDEGIYNILLLGTDGLEVEFVDDARADSIILLSLGLEDKTAKLTSFERGIGVPILSGEWEGHYDLITHIFAHGGADMIMGDIRECFGVNVERYVRVNFTALINVIDIIGGIDVDITEPEATYLNKIRTGKSVHPYINHGFIRAEGSKDHAYVVGPNRLTGSMALAYARLRAIDDDWGRIQRQRTVLQAVVNELKDADVATLNALADEILPLVQTNLTKAEIAELIFRAPGFLGVKFEQLSIPEEGTYGGMTGLYLQDMLAVDFEYNSKLIQEFIYGKTE